MHLDSKLNIFFEFTDKYGMLNLSIMEKKIKSFFKKGIDDLGIALGDLTFSKKKMRPYLKANFQDLNLPKTEIAAFSKDMNSVARDFRQAFATISHE